MRRGNSDQQLPPVGTRHHRGRTSAEALRYHAVMAAVTHRLSAGAALVALTALTALVVPVLSGCANSNKAAPASSLATSTSSGASWSRPTSPPDPQTLLRAAATAAAKTPDGTLTFIESETDDAGTWKVRLTSPDGTEQQLKIGVDGLTVLVGPTPNNDSTADKEKRRALLHGAQAAQLDYRSAVDKMLAAVPNGSITELKLTDANATTVWEAQVWDTYLVEHDVTVNAVSGDLVANKQV